MRIAIFGVAALAAIVGCSSSSDTLSPGPSTDLAGGGSTHSNDTTITNGPKTPPPPPPVVSSFTLSGAVYGRELGPDTAAVLPVPNAQLTIVKVATVDGDTLNPSVTSRRRRLTSMALIAWTTCHRPTIASTSPRQPARRTRTRRAGSVQQGNRRSRCTYRSPGSNGAVL